MIDLEKPPALSQSIAWTLLSRGPFHAWHEHPALGGLERPPTDAMEGGTLHHELVLGGDKVVVHDFPDWRTAKARGARAATRDDGKTPVLQKKVNAAQPAVDAILAALDAAGLSPRNFICEKRLRWKYGGIECEGTPDAHLINGDNANIWELKTTKKFGNRLTMGRHAAQNGWAIQREAYITALETLHPAVAGRVVWHWVIAEIEPPYQVRIVPAKPSLVELGRLQWERAVVTWGELLKVGWAEPWSDDWGAGLEAPDWELTREMAALDELIGGE